MLMKIKNNILFLGAALALLTACTSDDSLPTKEYTVGDADNLITLRAGVAESGQNLQTRAAGDVVYHKFKSATKLRLRVDGTWKGHKDTDGTTPKVEISQVTTATTAAEPTIDSDGDNSHILDTHTVTFLPSEKLFWDDYGTADPNNMSGSGNGRDKGLSIYGVAIDGLGTAPEVSDWTSIQWTLPQDQTSGWSSKDLLTSNNITAETNADGTYKFDDAKNNTGSNLLKFTHAMTKITVNLTAADGFVNGKFVSEPKVTLLGFNYIGTVDVESKVSTATKTGYTLVGSEENAATQDFNAYRDNGASWTSATTSTFNALVFPGNKFINTTNIIKIEADGNIYYVDASKINEVNTEPNDVFEQGKNYIFNIKVKKTEIKVTATITNWKDIEAEEVAPVININANWGDKDSGASDDFTGFSFYRSTEKLSSYNSTQKTSDGYYPAEVNASKPTDIAKQWPFKDLSNNDIKLYWPNHNAHLHFRGVWPQTSTETSNIDEVPHVKDLSNSDNTQIIDIKNVSYTSGSYPSDLMIGRPEMEETIKCSNTETGHTQTALYEGGICATEGLTTLNFRYVMSQVEVHLSTSATTEKNHVELGTNTTVEIINVSNTGYVKLGDRVVVPTETKETYILNQVTGDGNELKRHSAIVPQSLTYSTSGSSTNVRFKITVNNTDETTDVYYADINPILEKNKTTKVAPNGKWESGIHYKYELYITKTDIKVTATIKDWVTVNATENVWF